MPDLYIFIKWVKYETVIWKFSEIFIQPDLENATEVRRLAVPLAAGVTAASEDEQNSDCAVVGEEDCP